MQHPSRSGAGGRAARSRGWSCRWAGSWCPRCARPRSPAWNGPAGISTLATSGVQALLPKKTSAGKAELEADRLFGSALLPRIAVVQRNPDGLPLAQQRRIVGIAVRLDRGDLAGFPAGSRALPYVNTLGVVPGSRERGRPRLPTSGSRPSSRPISRTSTLRRYAQVVSVPGAPAAATGFIPGSIAQSDAIDDGLVWVEIAAILVVAVILGLYLRSPVAPLIALAAAGLAYLIAIHVMAYLADVSGLHVEQEVEPIVVVLLLGVVTDYSVFFLSGMRARLARRGGAPAGGPERNGRDPADRLHGRPARRRRAGDAASGRHRLRPALGPAMAIVVLVSLAVSILFVPAVMGILGRALFWPGLTRPARAAADADRVARTAQGGRRDEPEAWGRAGWRLQRSCSRSPRRAWPSRPLALTPIRGLAHGAPARRRRPRSGARASLPASSRRPRLVCGRTASAPTKSARAVRAQLTASRSVGAVIGAALAEPAPAGHGRPSGLPTAARCATSSPSITTRTARRGSPTCGGSRRRCRAARARRASGAGVGWLRGRHRDRR